MNESNLVPMWTACSQLRLSPMSLRKMAAAVHLDVLNDDGVPEATLASLRNLQGHVVEHYRQEMMEEWSRTVQYVLEQHGVRVRKAEALQITRYFCHASWDDGKTLE